MQNWSTYNSVEGCLPSISEVLCLFTRTEKKDLNAEHKSTSKLEESLVSWVWRLTPTNQHTRGKGRGGESHDRLSQSELQSKSFSQKKKKKRMKELALLITNKI